MRRPGRAAFVVAAGLSLCTSARADPVRVTILDELGQHQIDETIAVFSGGQLLGTLHVDPGHAADRFDVTLQGGTLEYALCGRLLLRDRAGVARRIPIDNGGRVAVAPGDTLRAFMRDDGLFGLEPMRVISEVTGPPACDAAIS